MGQTCVGAMSFDFVDATFALTLVWEERMDPPVMLDANQKCWKTITVRIVPE